MSRPDLFDVFSYCKISNSPLIGLNETSVALKLLHLAINDLELSLLFKQMGLKEISFSQFRELASWIKEKNKLQWENKSPEYLPLTLFSTSLVYAIENKIYASFLLPQTSSLLHPSSFFRTSSHPPSASPSLPPPYSSLLLLRSRMEKGYGLDPDLNARILWDEEGRRNGGFRGSWIDFWEYLGKCYSYMKEVKKEKVKDPSIGIIQLIRQSDEKKSKKCRYFLDYYVESNEERKFGLQICGWTDLMVFEEKNEGLNLICKKLEERGQHFRAMAIATFHLDFQKAYEIGLSLKQEKYKIYKNEMTVVMEILLVLKNITTALKNDKSLQVFFQTSEIDLERYPGDAPDPPEFVFRSSFFDPAGLLEELNSLKNSKAYKFSLIRNTLLFLRRISPNMEFKDPYLRLICRFMNFEIFIKTFLTELDVSFFDRAGLALRFMRNDNLLKAFAAYKTICFQKEGGGRRGEGASLQEKNTVNMSRSLNHPLSNNWIIPSNVTLNEQFGCRKEEGKGKKIQERGLRNEEEPGVELGILYGKSDCTISLLRKYLDATGDIQSVALASFLLRLMKFQEEGKMIGWCRWYREILNRLGLWEERIKIDRKFQEDLLSIDKQRKNIQKWSQFEDPLFAANFIAEKLDFCCCASDGRREEGVGSRNEGARRDEGGFEQRTYNRIFDCPKCQKPTSDCAICLLPVTTINTYLDQENQKKNMDKLEVEGYQFEEGVIWCQNCKHGGHYYHIMEWFGKYKTCAVTDCPCECNLL